MPDDDPTQVAEPPTDQLVVSVDEKGALKLNSELLEDSAYVDRMRRVLAAKRLGIFTVGGGVQSATGVVYIAELTSGKVMAYRFPYRNSPEKIAEVNPLIPMDAYPFRDAETK